MLIPPEEVIKPPHLRCWVPILTDLTKLRMVNPEYKDKLSFLTLDYHAPLQALNGLAKIPRAKLSPTGRFNSGLSHTLFWGFINFEYKINFIHVLLPYNTQNQLLL